MPSLPKGSWELPCSGVVFGWSCMPFPLPSLGPTSAVQRLEEGFGRGNNQLGP